MVYLLLVLDHSGMGMNTMMPSHESYCSNNKYLCMLLCHTMVL